MTIKMRNTIASVIFLLFGGFMFYASLGVKTVMSNDVGSGYVPRFIAILIMITAAGKLVLTLLDKNPGSRKKETSNSDALGGFGTIGLMLLYMLAFNSVGFILSTVCYLFAQMLLLSDNTNRKPILFAILSIVVPVAVYALFVYAISMPLPVGIFGF